MKIKSFDRAQIEELESRYRARLINSLSGYKSLNLVGTVDGENINNLAIFSSVIHIGSNPPMQAMISRPDTVARHTLDNIKEIGYYTLNQVHEGIYEEAHQASAKYDRNEDEFKKVGLTPWKLEGHNVPFVREAHIKTLMKLKEIVPININGTLMIIGEIMWCSMPEKALMEDGYIHLSETKTVVGGSLDGYYKVSPLSRLSYAKPNEKLKKTKL